MLQIQIPLPVKLIIAFIYSDENNYDKSKLILKKKFGKIDFQSQRIDFNFTDYYCPEMGKPLYRRVITFKKLIKPQKLVDAKLFCVKLEKKFSIDGKRPVNIDPGYINEAKLVLSTTKDFTHRIYLNKGIFAEVTLYFENRQFKHYQTTFPDYRTNEYKDIFLTIRKIYSKQIKIRG